MTRFADRRTLLVALIGLFAVAALTPAYAQTGPRVLVVGDSWAIFPAVEWGVWDSIFPANGHPEIEVFSPPVGELPGILARDYAAASGYVPGLLASHPTVEWIVLSLGGNDMLGDYQSGDSSGWVDRLEDAYRDILNPIIDARPDIKILFPGYDFVNFEKNAFCIWQAVEIFHGLLTPQINVELLRISEAQFRMADEFSNVTAVAVWGTLQAAGGVPDPPNILYPSPAEYMNSPDPDIDCIHASQEGYGLIEQAVYDAYFPGQFACTQDADGDGFEDAACGGVDCDDANPAVNPAADEIQGNGIDDDCNATTSDSGGGFPCAAAVVPGGGPPSAGDALSYLLLLLSPAGVALLWRSGLGRASRESCRRR